MPALQQQREVRARRGNSLLHFGISALRNFSLPPGHFRGKVSAALDITLRLPQSLPQQPHLQQQRLANLIKTIKMTTMRTRCTVQLLSMRACQ
jgi:hypothetical protein